MVSNRTAISEPVLQEDPDVSLDLTGHIPALFVTLGGKIGLHAARHSARQLGLDLREWRIIQAVGAGNRSRILDIADTIGMDPGGTSRSVARLEEKGILERENDSADRRRSFVRLSDKGWTYHDRIARFAVAREEHLLRRFSPEESALLKQQLKTILEEADAMIAHGWVPQKV